MNEMPMAIVLSGCGVYDGSEIHESVCTMLALSRSGVKYQCFAPDDVAVPVVDHVSGVATTELRTPMIEAARIARGDIQPLQKLVCKDFRGVIFPGGFGAAKVLCNFAEKGASCEVHPEVARVIKEFHQLQRPQGFICIAPVIAARLLGSMGVQLTIGNDTSTAQALGSMGAKHVPAAVEVAVVDRAHKIVSTPAYMLATGVAEVERSVSALVQEMQKLCSSTSRA